MAWTTPITFVGNAILTAAQLNTYLRDNMLETAPAKATTEGGYFVTTGANALAERNAATKRVAAEQSTTSSTFVDLATPGPAITCVTGTRAIVMVSSRMYNNLADDTCWHSWAISGATTRAATDDWGLIGQVPGTGSANSYRLTAVDMAESLNPGTNTFTCKYQARAGSTATFLDRHISVWPL